MDLEEVFGQRDPNQRFLSKTPFHFKSGHVRWSARENERLRINGETFVPDFDQNAARNDPETTKNQQKFDNLNSMGGVRGGAGSEKWRRLEDT